MVWDSIPYIDTWDLLDANTLVGVEMDSRVRPAPVHQLVFVLLLYIWLTCDSE